MADERPTSLTRLHDDNALIPSKLKRFRKLDDAAIEESLQAPGDERLRIRSDGTVMQGNHRVKVLEERGYDLATLIPHAEIVDED